MDDEDVAPLVDWTKPYTPAVMLWATKTLDHIGVVPASEKTCTFSDAWRVALVECPVGSWCAWVLDKGQPTGWAHVMDTEAPAFADMSSRQALRVGYNDPAPPPAAR